jgi:hypothetical protein
MSVLDLFATWLGFFGIVAGLVLAAVYGWRPLRSAVAGYVCGVAVVVFVNVLTPTAAPCLQEAKGGDILRAYSIRCPDPNADLPGGRKK